MKTPLSGLSTESLSSAERPSVPASLLRTVLAFGSLALVCLVTQACSTPPVVEQISRCNPDDDMVYTCDSCPAGATGEARCGADGQIGECICPSRMTDAGMDDAG